jgi:hypothetical protein
MTGSEIDGSRGFKSSPLHQPDRFCAALPRPAGTSCVHAGFCAEEKEDWPQHIVRTYLGICESGTALACSTFAGSAAMERRGDMEIVAAKAAQPARTV